MEIDLRIKARRAGANKRENRPVTKNAMAIAYTDVCYWHKADIKTAHSITSSARARIDGGMVERLQGPRA